MGGLALCWKRSHQVISRLATTFNVLVVHEILVLGTPNIIYMLCGFEEYNHKTEVDRLLNLRVQNVYEVYVCFVDMMRNVSFLFVFLA